MQRRFPRRGADRFEARKPADGRARIAAHMRRLRRARALSQDKLAELTGLSRVYLSSVENCQRNISVDNICKVAAALGVEPSALLEPDAS